jgi:hypothetical protein
MRTVLLLVCAVGLLGAARPSLSPAAVRPLGEVSLATVRYQGRQALRVADAAPAGSQADQFVVLGGPDFHDGVIELWVAGEPGPTASATARGFVGVMFRLSADAKAGEAFYLRPTNGRAEDQERRNHAVQYVSRPDWPWERLRRETPSRYESYADLQPGRWHRMRVEVSGARARLYVDGAEQPTLIVNDLKLGAEARGAVALWIGPGTVAHFAGVTVEGR